MRLGPRLILPETHTLAGVFVAPVESKLQSFIMITESGASGSNPSEVTTKTMNVDYETAQIALDELTDHQD